MRLKTSILILGWVTVLSYRGSCQHIDGPGQALMGAQQQSSSDYYQLQLRQIIAAADKAAAQAAASAKDAAQYDNEAATHAADYAAQAARYAAVADGRTSYLSVSEFRISIAEAAAAAQEAAANAKQAAKQAEIDSGVTKLENERDGIIAQLKAKYDPSLSDLKLQISTLKQKTMELERQKSLSEEENAHLRAKQLFQPKDSWRMLDGKVYNAKDESWFLFTGKVLEVRPNGILIHGDFGPPLEAGFGERDFFVENFPIQTYPVADGESITTNMNLVAHMSEKASVYEFTNTTIDLRGHTVRRLDYGTIVASPPPDLAQKWNNIIIVGDSNPELTKQLDDNNIQQSAIEVKLQKLNDDFDREKEPIMAEYDAKIKDVPVEITKRAKEAEEAKKKAVTDKVLKNNQDLADKGDPYGLLRMGERCRDGEGVEKDLTKARDYLTKAAAAGSPTAAEELKKLPEN